MDVLAEHFGSLTKLAGASKEELMAVGNLQFPGDREKNINKMLEYFRMPFNEPLERLRQAGEVDMLPLDAVIYAWIYLELISIRLNCYLLSLIIFIVFTRQHWTRSRRLTKCHVRMPSVCIVFTGKRKVYPENEYLERVSFTRKIGG